MATPKNVSKALDAGQRVSKGDRPIRGKAARSLPVEPPILSPGVDPARISEVEADINAMRAELGIPPISYQKPGDNVSRIRFEQGTGPNQGPNQYEPLAEQMGPFSRTDANLGHGTSQLRQLPTEDGGLGWAQKTAIQQLMDIILHQKSTARSTTTGLQYDPKTGQRTIRARERGVSDGGRAHALLESLFHEDPMFPVRIKDEFDRLPEEGKDHVYRAIANEFPNERTSPTGAGGRVAVGWSSMADDLVKVLHDGEWNPERMAEVDRVNSGDSTPMTERIPGRGGEEAYRTAEDSRGFEFTRERTLGGTGADEWAPQDPGVVIPPPRYPAPAGAVDDELIKTDREGKSAFHSEPGSQVNKPLDKYFNTTVVDIPERLPQDSRAYRQELERLTTQQLLTGKTMPGGKMNAVSPNSDTGRFLAKQAQSMSIPQMQAILRENSISFPESPADLPALSDTSRPTPVRVMDEVPYEDARHLVDPKTFSQIEAIRKYEQQKADFDAGKTNREPIPPRVMARSDRELPAMLAQDRTPQEQFDKNLHDFLYSESDNLRRNALERLWERMQADGATANSPMEEGSGVNGKTPQEQSRNLLESMFSQASPGFMDEVSDIRRMSGQELMDDHFFTPGRREQFMEDAQVRKATKKSGDEAEEVGFGEDEAPIDDGSLPDTLAGDPVNFNRNEPATKKAKTNNEQLSIDLAKQDARQVAASKKRVDRPIVDSPNQRFTQDLGTLEAKGIEPGTLDDKYEAIRAMYLREFGQNPAAPEGVPNNFNKMASGEWMPAPTRIWSTKSRLFAKAQPASDHIATLGSGQVSPEALAAAKAEANRMRREIATNSGTASSKAASKELLRLDGAIKAYEKKSGAQAPAPAPAGKGRMAELQEKVAAKDTPKPRPPKAGPDPHIAMSKVASKSKRTAKESAALQEYMATLVNGSDDPSMQRKLDDINEKLEASRGAKKTPAPKKGSEPREVGPAPAEDTAGLESMSEKQALADPEPVDQVAPQPEPQVKQEAPQPDEAPQAKTPELTSEELFRQNFPFGTSDEHLDLLSDELVADDDLDRAKAWIDWSKKNRDPNDTSWDSTQGAAVKAVEKAYADAVNKIDTAQGDFDAQMTQDEPRPDPIVTADSKGVAAAETASEFDDPMYGAPEDEPDAEFVPDSDEAAADLAPRPGEAEVLADAEAASPDLNAEASPSGDSGTVIDPAASTDVDSPKPDKADKPGRPARKIPWKAAAVVGAAVGGGAIINALRQGASNTHVDPFFPAPGGKGGDAQDAGEAGSMGPMTAREMQSRKPFHALTPEERIRFLRTRYNQATPSTLTRPY